MQILNWNTYGLQRKHNKTYFQLLFADMWIPVDIVRALGPEKLKQQQ